MRADSKPYVDSSSTISWKETFRQTPIVVLLFLVDIKLKIFS